MGNNDKRETGLRIIESYFGFTPPSAHEDTPLAEQTVEHVFGEIWNRPGLGLRDRSMITLAALIALNRPEQFRVHLKGALNVGITRAEIEELILHLAHYAGWPAAVTAMNAAKEIFEEQHD